LGLAQLSKVTVISPRSEYGEVASGLARFEDFHPIGQDELNFDPKLQELSIKAVRLFAQADQAVKDLSIPLMPGVIDIVFRGVKIPKSEFDAESWETLLNDAEVQINPIIDEVRAQRALLQKVAKEESDLNSLRDALQAVAGFSADVGDLGQFQRLRVVLTVVRSEVLAELKNSLPSSIFLSQPLGPSRSLVLVASEKSDEARIEKTLKALDLKPLSIPSNLPQNPAEAYAKLTQDCEATRKERFELEAKVGQLRSKHEVVILAVREVAEVARETLDQEGSPGP